MHAAADGDLALPEAQVSGLWRARICSPSSKSDAGDADADVEKLVSLSMGRAGRRPHLRTSRRSPERRDEAMRFLEELSAPAGRADEVSPHYDRLRTGGERCFGKKRDDSLFGNASRAASRYTHHAGIARDDRIVACGHTGGAGRHGRSVGEAHGSDQSLERVGSAIRDVGGGNTNPSLTLETLVYFPAGGPFPPGFEVRK